MVLQPLKSFAFTCLSTNILIIGCDINLRVHIQRLIKYFTRLILNDCDAIYLYVCIKCIILLKYSAPQIHTLDVRFGKYTRVERMLVIGWVCVLCALVLILPPNPDGAQENAATEREKA